MIRIAISAEAYAAIVSGRDPDSLLESQKCPQGGFYLWLDKLTLTKLAAARGPAEGYSEAILRLAKEPA